MNSRLLAASIVAVLLLSTFASASANPKAEKAAVEAANQWLALVDAGNYDASWDTAARHFKSAVSKAQWTKMMQANRVPLGKLESRKLKSATYTTTLPGAPDGEYVVIQYDSSFTHKKTAIETVTPMLDKDGHWRVSGYFIR